MIAVLLASFALATPRPNVVLVLADDLGIGDARCYNPESRIPTPAMDRLASEGVRFTDAHSPSAVCTPTRYALLTGRYAWRTRMTSWVLNGDGRLLVDRPTIANAFDDAGYATACIGKWHLGLGSFDPEVPDRKATYDGPIDAGPHTCGFDEVFVIPASLDMPPYCFIVRNEVQDPLTARTPGSSRRWSDGGGFWREGPMSPSFDFEQVLPRVFEEARVFIEESRDEPFFLYVPLPAPHTPWMPTPEYQGTTRAGWYGDFVHQVDAGIGRLLDTLDEFELDADTIVIVTSDNGSHWRPRDIETYGHDANLGYRGMKADIHEAGHRVPLLVRWPGHIEPGTTSDALVGLHDIGATLASIVGLDFEGEDGLSFRAALEGDDPGRDTLVHHSGDGLFAIRRGRWKLVDGLGSGGFTSPRRPEPEAEGPTVQLYDLESDPKETTNLALRHPDVVESLREALDALRR